MSNSMMKNMDVSERVDEGLANAKDIAAKATDVASGSVTRAWSRVNEYADDLKQGIVKATDRVREVGDDLLQDTQVRRVFDTVSRRVRRYPVTAMFAGLAVGLLAGRLTRKN